MKSIVLFLLVVIGMGFGLSSFAEELPLWKKSKLVQLQNAEAKLKDAEAQVHAHPDRNPLDYLNSPLQRLGTLRSFVGDAYGAMESFDRWMLLSGRQEVIRVGDLDRLQKATAVDAIAAIVDEARHRQIVILNEAHQMPLHRAFAMRLARELRKIGYSYLACETCEQPFEYGYLKQSTGYYSQEPMYANFLRDAAKDAWKFVQYDMMQYDKNLSAEDNQQRRERAQAANIVAATLQHDAAAKIFIYVGHGHGMKQRSDPEQSKMMAEYLSELTQITPLSIDQTTFYEHALPAVEHPLYQSALAHQAQQGAFVLRSSLSGFAVFGRYQARVDMQVIHPRTPWDSRSHRYAWLSDLAGLTATAIPSHLLPTQGRRVIYAYRLEETVDAVPVDAVIVELGKPIPMLMLPKGEFRFEFEDD